MSIDYQLTDIATLDFLQRRWDVTIRVTHTDGQVTEYVASADSVYTSGSGIYFGTREEYDAEAAA